MIFHPASNEHTAHTREGSLIQSQETQTPSGHGTSRGLPSCSSASAALSPAPKLPGIIRQPRAGPECSTLTTRTNLRADLCFCNGHLTPCESWLCSCMLQLPSCHILRARDSCHRVHGLSVSESRRRAMRRDGGRSLANRPAHQDSPRETSIDLPCLPSGITTPLSISTTGRTRPITPLTPRPYPFRGCRPLFRRKFATIRDVGQSDLLHSIPNPKNIDNFNLLSFSTIKFILIVKEGI